VAPNVELEVTGAFKWLPDGLAADMKPGDKFPPTGNTIAEILSIAAPIAGEVRVRVGDETVRVPSNEPELPATLRVNCYTVRTPDGTARCLVPSPSVPVALAPDALLTLLGPHGVVMFQIDVARAPHTTTAVPSSHR
jgi:hypothetical protein